MISHTKWTSEQLTTTQQSIWIDLINPSDPLLFRGIMESLDTVQTAVTARHKTETAQLSADVGFDHTVVGRDFENLLLRKLGIPWRTLRLLFEAPTADFSFSSRNIMCILASAIKGIPSIHFTDNDITAFCDGLKYEELYNRLESKATYNIVPSVFKTKELTKWGATSSQILTYDGYKEDLYVAAFEPDNSFTQKLPFDEYIVVRPEALSATYVDAQSSIVPELLEGAVERGFNVVYLPRGRGDEKYAKTITSSDLFIPDQALHGLQLAWHSQCVLTGSGTMAREAACMSKPAVSFFPNALLSVDQQLCSTDRIFHSRDVEEILAYLESLAETQYCPDRTRAHEVHENVCNMLREIL